MKVPFLDLNVQNESIKEELFAEIQAVLDCSAFAGGPFVKAFENKFARFCQCDHAIGVGSGTDALWVALLSLGVGPGDEVITVPNTFIATAEAISYCGAQPVFVDIDEASYTMNPDLLEAAISDKTKAIIPVHLYGQPCDMDPILAIAKKWGLYVVEDACQAHGAEYKGKRAGSMGDAGCFSFYPGKNLGACGEAGAIVTNNTALADRMKMFRDHGQDQKYSHSMIGWNARMDGIQGAILTIKLKYLPQWTEARRENAKRYQERLDPEESVIAPVEMAYAKHVHQVYAVRAKNRDALLAELRDREIFCGIHYPVPIHFQEAYASMGLGPASFPVAERCAEEILSLPMFPELSHEQIDFVCHAVNSCLIEQEHTETIRSI
jgi:dTDP-4-amino-4,6-dideoxygalactose transaminase